MFKNIILICVSLFVLVGKGYCGSKNNSNVIKFNPLELFNGHYYRSSTFQLSYERQIFKKYSINQDIGYVFYNKVIPSITAMILLDDLYGYSFETEIRRYLMNQKINSGMYTGIGIFYKYLEAKDTNYEPDEKYTIFRHEVACHIKIGYQHINQNGFTHDYSIGLGWRGITSSNTSSNNVIHDPGKTKPEILSDKFFFEGSGQFFSITLAVRFGWKL
jgi:hypothetical protein